MADQPQSKKNIILQLGDIIKINSPNDTTIHHKVLYIDYIDKSEITLIDQSKGKITLFINENGQFTNEFIKDIELLSRAEYPGYARQNGLIKGVWADYYFSGDEPMVITGEITNVIEDQIEILPLGSNESIYIDFGYKGIPKELGLETIKIRSVPRSIQEQQLKPVKEAEPDMDDERKTKQPSDSDVTMSKTPGLEVDADVDADAAAETDEEEHLRDLILEADQIVFGDELDDITQIVDVPEEEQLYGIEKQTNDLLDELLAEVPSVQRTRHVLNNIHLIIERFQQLRKMYSTFNLDNGTLSPIIHGPDYKPLLDALQHQNKKLYWILPVVHDRVKLYDLDIGMDEEYEDVVSLTLAETRIEETEALKAYNEGTLPSSESKYGAYLKIIAKQSLPYLPPTTSSNSFNIDVGDKITGVVNNFDDYYSSTVKNEEINRKRFSIQEFTKGFSLLHFTKNKHGTITTTKENVVKNDPIYIKSFITFPKSVVSFSRINLPGTSVLKRVNLSQNFLKYWKLLTDTASINPVFIEGAQSVKHKSSRYLKYITDFVPTEPIYTSESFKNYVDSFIPNTKELFSLLKSNLLNRYSIHSVIKGLEPFLIYHDAIRVEQYKEFEKQIHHEIKVYKQFQKEQHKLLSQVKFTTTHKKQEPNLLRILRTDKVLYDNILSNYLLPADKIYLWSDSEVFGRMIKVDNAKFYMATLATKTAALMIADGTLKLQDLETWILENKQKMKEKESVCPKYELSKHYKSIADLEGDNNKEIYYDKQYDTTYYDVIHDYKEELDKIPETAENTERLQWLMNKLKESVQASDDFARREAIALLRGKRVIEDGDYALTTINDERGMRFMYFKRENMQWVPTKDIDKDSFSNKNKTLCNLNESCIRINKCQSFDSAGLELNEQNAQKMLNEFDSQVKRSKAYVETRITEQYNTAQSRISKLISILNKQKYKYDYEQSKLVEPSRAATPTSPHAPLRDIILGQGDFAKKQEDIEQFILKYTRPANEDEDEWWLYCVDSNTKLLPSFFQQLASAFLKDEDYLHALDNVRKIRGTISDDGEAWVDKYSGYFIVPISFDVNEGYTEDGFKQISREKLQEDIGDVITQSGKIKKTFTTPDANAIARVARAIGKFVGISVENYLEFIITNTISLQTETMPSKARYEKLMEAAKLKGKKRVETYENTFNQSLIVITLSYLLISFLTSIPSIRTRKRHPGCVRSFHGFPLDGDEDKSGLKYIACVAHKIKSSIKPWNAISRWSEANITKRMESFILRFIIKNEAVISLIATKKAYLRLNPVQHEIDTTTLKEWVTFLPVMNPIKLETMRKPTVDFLTELTREIKTNNPQQFAKIALLQSKIIYFSIKFQELVHGVVKTKYGLLSNNSNEPFIENSCCDDGVKDTYDYFIQEKSLIATVNTDIKEISDTLRDISLMSKAPFLFDPTDTKLKYPELFKTFSEATIYKAFIKYCKYDSTLPISENLQAICGTKPRDFDVTSSLSKQIQQLKSQGRQYGEQQIQNLLQIINSKNIVDIDLYKAELNPIQKLRDLLIESRENDSNSLPEVFRTKLENLLDTFKMGGLKKETEIIRDFKNYLFKSNEFTTATILDFIKRNAPRKLHTQVKKCLEEFANNDNEISNNDELLRMLTYIKDAVRSIARVFPNIIVNGVDFSNVLPPAHWKLSDIHKKDFKEFINRYYTPLYKFYEDDALKVLINHVEYSVTEIESYIHKTPFYLSVQDESEKRHSIFDEELSLMLSKYYFLAIFYTYIEGLESEDVVAATLQPTSRDLSSAVETLEELERGELPDAEILSGQRTFLENKVSSLLSAFATIVCNQKKTTHYDYDAIKDKVRRFKEKEKNTITSVLKDMTDEQREIDNMFKKHKLARWGVGLQKGLRIYQKDTYDKERDDMEKQTLLEAKLKDKDFVTDMNREIYALDEIVEEEEAKQIEEEEYNLSHLADDDDYGDNDGDEGFY